MKNRQLIILITALLAASVIANVIFITILAMQTTWTVEKEKDSKKNQMKLASVFDYAEAAKKKLSNRKDGAWYYFEDGATTQLTLKDNHDAFNRYRLLPMNLIDVSKATINTTILGEPVTMPIGISPAAFQTWAHPDGEIGTAKAAQNKGIVACFSAYSYTSMENIATAAPGALLWQQLYLFGLKNYTLNFVRRAEQNGYKALVVTIDRPWSGVRYNAKRKLIKYPDKSPPNLPDYTFGLERKLVNPGQTWEELKWLRQQTRLKIIVKGILRQEDARKAIKAGVDAILVSNHGGRVLDGVPATIDVLADIVKEVGSDVEVYLDGGIRTGMDIIKAIAMGARAAFIGRPMIYGLAVGGQQGVEDVLNKLRKEFLTSMMIMGTDRPEKLNLSMIINPQCKL